MMRRIIFRADGNPQIGSGHIMRCLSIAEAARRQGYTCCFVTAGKEMTEKIAQKEFRFFVMNSDYSHMDDEVEAFERISFEFSPNLIFIDSYYVTSAYLRRIKGFAKTVYIDDLAEFAYPVDFLLNYSIYADEIDYVSLYHKSNITLPDILAGSNYIPLRSEFQVTEDKRRNNFERRQILVTTGSSDPYKIILRMIKKIISCDDLQKYDYHFIVGSLCEDTKEIIENTSLIQSIYIHSEVKSMGALMKNCDIAVSAGGTTLYELCACGVPTISFIMADNQSMNVRTFEKRGIMLCAGDCRTSENFISNLFSMIKSLCENYELQSELLSKTSSAVDAGGADNIIKYITSKIKEKIL